MHSELGKLVETSVYGGGLCLQKRESKEVRLSVRTKEMVESKYLKVQAEDGEIMTAGGSQVETASMGLIKEKLRRKTTKGENLRAWFMNEVCGMKV